MKFPPLSQLTKDLFDLPPTAQRQSNICSMVNFYPEVKRIMDAISMTSVTEIGSETGENTAALLAYARTRNLFLTTVDPVDVPFPFEKSSEPLFTFYQGVSKDYLHTDYRSDVIFMDGDHNYETVIADLLSIHQNREKSGIKIIFLHDVSWPWARRDLYYDVTRVANPLPNQEQTAVSPYQSDNQYYLPSTGYNAANSEGTNCNGVLTAVEDFLAAQEKSWKYWHVPVIYGIGVLLCVDNLSGKEYKAVSSLLDDLLLHRELLATLELNRLENLCYLQYLKDEIQRAGDVWRSDQRYIDEVNAHLADFTQKLNSVNSQFEFLQKIDSEKNLRIEELQKNLNLSVENECFQKNVCEKLLKQIEQLQSQFDQEKLICDDLRNTIKTLTEQVFQLELEKNDAAHKISSLEDDHARVSEKLKEETALRHSSEEALQKKSADFEVAQQEFAAASQQLNIALTAKSEELVQLQNVLSDKETTLSRLNEQLAATESDRARITAEKESVTADLTSALSEKAEELVQLQNVLSDKETALSRLNEQLAATESDRARITAEKESVTADLTSALSLRTDENMHLQARLGRSEQTVSDLEGQLQKTTLERDIELKEKSELNQKLHQLEKEKDSLRGDCDAAHAEVWKRDQELRRLNLEKLSEHWRIENNGWLSSFSYHQCNKKKFAKMKEQLLNGQIKVLSLDVFDTLLFRGCHSELQRFMDIGKLMNQSFPAVSPRYFYEARAVAHRIAYQSKASVQGCREPQASAIFHCMCSILNLAEEDADTLAAIELDYEVAHLRPNPAVCELVRIANERNIPVIAVSDMYWNSDAIRQIIQRVPCDGWRIDRVYSSSDGGISKSSGLLFDHVLKQEQCSPETMLHIGDNKNSDCVRPYLRHGINAIWVPRPECYNKYCRKQQNKYMKQLQKRGVINGL